jgi:hypothetical protein
VTSKALFVYIGLYPESFRLIKVYINYRSNPARNYSDPPIRHKRTSPKIDREPMGLAVADAPVRQACWNLDSLSREAVRQQEPGSLEDGTGTSLLGFMSGSSDCNWNASGATRWTLPSTIPRFHSLSSGPPPWLHVESLSFYRLKFRSCHIRCLNVYYGY